MILTHSQRRALEKAANRPGGAICPVVTHKGRVDGNAEQMVLDALDRRGVIWWDGIIPRINNAGRAAVEA